VCIIRLPEGRMSSDVHAIRELERRRDKPLNRGRRFFCFLTRSLYTIARPTKSYRSRRSAPPGRSCPSDAALVFVRFSQFRVFSVKYKNTRPRMQPAALRGQKETKAGHEYQYISWVRTVENLGFNLTSGLVWQGLALRRRNLRTDL
jgi:hypothetical protein